ncbi:MAG: hypothetical protein KF795_11140 [Labilithrix sp.]|nr:hypothetical protein [Labilithrix sp.]
MDTPSKKRALGRSGYVGLIALTLFAGGCRKRALPGSATTTTSATATATTSATATEPVAKGPDDKPLPRPSAKASRPQLDPVLKFVPADGLRGPASVLHDEVSDVYFVSNVDGAPAAADGKGFISKLSPDGKKILLRWIDGGKNKVVLNAPKGMAIQGNELYVADIDTVRVFDRRSGAPLGKVTVEGATFLDDLAVTADGRILVSDTGLRASAGGGLEESGTDAIYSIYWDRYGSNFVLFAKKELAGPTALFVTPNKIWGVASRTGEIFSIGPKGKLEDVHRLPDGALEGIVGTGSDLLVASRAASAIFRGKPDGDWRIAIGDVKSPADIGYDEKRKRVLVPLFTEDEVRIFQLE